MAKYSIILVERHSGGVVSGPWVQDVIGTPAEAVAATLATYNANGKKNHYALIPQVTSINSAHELFHEIIHELWPEPSAFAIDTPNPELKRMMSTGLEAIHHLKEVVGMLGAEWYQVDEVADAIKFMKTIDPDYTP